MDHDSKGTINTAEQFSLSRIATLSTLFVETDVGKQLVAAGASLVVVGSLGRLESLQCSDVDLVTIYPDDRSLEQIQPLDRAARDFVRTRIGVEVSKGENFTGPTRLKDIADQSMIGGTNDNVNALTKRVGILTEARVILNPDFSLEFSRELMGAYLATAEVRRRYFVSIADEIVRYYRTLCVDYKSRVDGENKPWAIRYLKLRCSRKYWFFSLMLGMTGILVESEPRENQAIEKLAALLAQSPTQRIVDALAAAALPRSSAIFAYYGNFLKGMSEHQVRTQIENLDYANRHAHEEFVRMKAHADRLHRSMLEIIESLPAAWRRHLFSRFLLHS